MAVPTADLVSTASKQLQRDFEQADAAWNKAWSKVCELEREHERALELYSKATERRTKAEDALKQATGLLELVS